MATWFITGCSSGLGNGIARAALEEGEKVVMTSRDITKLDALTKEYPETSLAVYMDFSDAESMNHALELAKERFGEVDVLVNNAGHGYRATVEESEDEGIRNVFNDNFFAPAQLIRMLLPEMRKQRNGLIVNVTSIGAVRGALGNGYYSAAKGALELLTESLAKEVKEFGIRTMVVEPGAFQTNFYGTNLDESSIKIEDYATIAEKYRKDYVKPSAPKKGDPKKGGKIIVDIIMKNEFPECLLLGSDAISVAEMTYLDKIDELNKWKEISIQSDF